MKRILLITAFYSCVFASLLTLLLRNETLLAAALGGERTLYSTGYSDRGFEAVQIGMSSNEVAKILGNPLRKYEPEGIVPPTTEWIYSDCDPSGRSGNFRVRIVIFDKANSSVTAKRRGLYID